MGQSVSVAGRHRRQGIERWRWRRMLPFRNAACTGQSGAETVIPLRAAASDANLKL